MEGAKKVWVRTPGGNVMGPHRSQLRTIPDDEIRVIRFGEEDEILKNVDNEAGLIKFQYYFNKLLQTVNKIDNKEKYLSQNIILYISYNNNIICSCRLSIFSFNSGKCL